MNKPLPLPKKNDHEFDVVNPAKLQQDAYLMALNMSGLALAEVAMLLSKTEKEVVDRFMKLVANWETVHGKAVLHETRVKMWGEERARQIEGNLEQTTKKEVKRHGSKKQA